MTAVPGLPSGQQAYMSNVRLQKSPSNSSEGGKNRWSDAGGTATSIPTIPASCQHLQRGWHHPERGPGAPRQPQPPRASQPRGIPPEMWRHPSAPGSSLCRRPAQRMLKEGLNPAPAVAQLRMSPRLTPSWGAAGYLLGRARLPSSSSTHHGTASTPRRSSPAPWPCRAASPELGQSLRLAAAHQGTEPVLACPPHRGTWRLPTPAACIPPMNCCVPASSRQAGTCDKARSESFRNRSKPSSANPAAPWASPSLPLTVTEENRHIQARWTRLRQFPDPSTSLIASPTSPQPVLPAPGCVSRLCWGPGSWARGGELRTAQLCWPPTLVQMRRRAL